MIVELDIKDFHNARILFQDLEKYILGITSVFEGNSAGMIFVNKKRNPTSSFMYLGKSSIIFAGDSNDDSFNQSLKLFFQKTIIPRIKENNESNSFSIYCEQEWKEKIKLIFDNLQTIRRVFYQFNSIRFKDWREKLPDGFSIKFIDKNLLSNQKLKNTKYMHSWIKGCWKTEDNYLERGFGFCIINEDVEIASICLCNYLSEDQTKCEIGIFTSEKFQKQGLAKILTTKMINYCFTRNIKRIDWHTREENIASLRTAETIGFELKKDFEILLGSL